MLTEDQIKKLSSKEIQEKIAELCKLPEMGMMGSTLIYIENNTFTDVPDYCNDLNAMHLIEAKFLTYSESIVYENYLEKLNGWEGNGNVWIWHASAHRRAIAFLLTKSSKKKMDPKELKKQVDAYEKIERYCQSLKQLKEHPLCYKKHS